MKRGEMKKELNAGKSAVVLVVFSWVASGAWSYMNSPRPLESPQWKTQELLFFLESIPSNSRGLQKEHPRVQKPKGQARPKHMLELNSADSIALEALPFIGPVLSARVIKYRNALGGFFEIEQLKEVYGLDSLAFAVVSQRVHVDASKVNLICVDTASWNRLRSHPYIGYEGARSIERYRNAHGIGSMDDLAAHPPIGDSLARRWSPYLRICQRDG